ncbi:hypothetical protein [Desulfurococcus sp.]|uniref:hypothetical protein n=1 Tax=Desulfurococcus sp. TaxID=51678 RepID=UPI003163162F
MSTQLRRGGRVGKRRRQGRSSLVTASIVLALVFIGLIALVERGPIVPGFPVGASPFNPLSFGTLGLVKDLEHYYTVRIASSMEDLNRLTGGKCIYVVISPEKPFAASEAEYIVKSLSERCREAVVLIGDESTYSNGLLEALNTSIRVTGSRIYVGQCSDMACGYSPYPRARLILGNRSFNLVLDKASNLIGRGIMWGYITEGCVVTLPGAGGFECSSITVGANEIIEAGIQDPVVALEDHGSRIPVYVIGDGSIFLNQVINSGNHSEYKVFVLELFQYLCGGESGCIIVFDNMHYETINAFNLLVNPGLITGAGAGLSDILYVFSLILATIIHPSFWMPLVFKFVDELFSSFLANMFLAILVLLAVTIVVDKYLTRGIVFRGDEVLREQVERDITVFESVRRKIIEKKEKLGRDDFLNIYWLANQVSTMILGVEVSSPAFIERISQYVGRDLASSYWSYMNKLYRRATGESWRPLIVRWHSEALKAYSETEKILSLITSRLQIEDYRRLLAGI